LLLGLTACAAMAQTTPDGEIPLGPLDTCGTLVQTGDCVLFEGGGGSFYIADYGDFRVGDTVHVVGTITECTNICSQADGCISGAQLFDPVLEPCGAPVTSFEAELCTAASASLVGALGAGFFVARPRHRQRKLTTCRHSENARVP
jgi:hypothetical protein